MRLIKPDIIKNIIDKHAQKYGVGSLVVTDPKAELFEVFRKHNKTGCFIGISGSGKSIRIDEKTQGK